jgi:hypothetical protein
MGHLRVGRLAEVVPVRRMESVAKHLSFVPGPDGVSEAISEKSDAPSGGGWESRPPPSMVGLPERDHPVLEQAGRGNRHSEANLPLELLRAGTKAGAGPGSAAVDLRTTRRPPGELRARISPSKTVGALSGRQRARLIELLSR